MDKITGQFYIDNNKLIRSDYLNYSFNNSDYRFYEVIRTAKGIFLFFEDHLARLQESLISLNLNQLFEISDARNCLDSLIKANNFLEGNVKLLCKVKNNKLEYSSYYIPHNYPAKELYETGIKLKPYVIERIQPNIKQIQVNENLKKQISEITANADFYEILLVNHNGYITEGSKSNFFLVKENTLYSAPESLILKGITRKYVLKVAKKLGLEYQEKLISLNDIALYESAFICGTSPKVLPVNEIDGISFDIYNPVLRSILNSYNILFEQLLNKVS